MGLAAVFAVALAIFGLATAVAQLVVSVISQHAGDLAFRAWHTEFAFFSVLIYAIALALTTLALWAVWRLEARVLRTCPACKSEIPNAATVCRYCSTELGDD